MPDVYSRKERRWEIPPALPWYNSKTENVGEERIARLEETIRGYENKLEKQRVLEMAFVKKDMRVLSNLQDIKTNYYRLLPLIVK